MADRTIDQILSGCTRVWEASGVPAQTIADMRSELHAHLDAAARAGKPVDAVVGTDLDSFAEEWAAIYGGSLDQPGPAATPFVVHIEVDLVDNGNIGRRLRGDGRSGTEGRYDEC